ncbi:hypothetical protein Q9233_007419 [Columba guinea]|nr:hypothetical protein Q9233_007419 [Columba guinea]
MTNQLPAVTSGSTVTFDMEVVPLGPSSNEGGTSKLRVTISSNNREVVFDWPGPGPWSLLKKTTTPVAKAAGTGAFINTPLASRTFFMRRYRVFLLGNTSQSRIDELQQQIPD